MSDIGSSSDGGGNTSASVLCTLCNTDLTPLGVAARNAHVEECLDTSVIVPDRPALTETDDLSATLALLDDCPVCGKAWMVSAASRSKHAKTCAAQHGLSSKDLAGLIDMFRESLGEPSLQSNRSAGSTATSRCSNSSASSFSRAFSPQQHRPTAAKGTGSSKGKRTAKKTAAGSASKPIDRWFGRQTSEELESTNSDFDKQHRRQSPAGSFVFEISEDEDFESTKVRVPLRQSVISMRRVGKKRQEVLDEFDDELNEAKALSLSLSRGPDPARIGKTASKRRDARTKSAELLGRSDILASEEAQSYIRQRAVALERMDMERMDMERMDMEHQANLQNVSGQTVAGAFGENDLQPVCTSNLWKVGSQDCTPDKMYCPLFENYRMGHEDHTSDRDCVDELLGHVLRSLALESQGPIPAADRNAALCSESSLREGYLQLLQAARQAFSRQLATLRCAKWVDTAPSSGSRDSVADEGLKDNTVDPSLKDDTPSHNNIVLLSSSESSPSLPDSVGIQNINLNCTSQTLSTRDVQIPDKSKMPDYAKMSIDELKSAAASYGLRVNTPRRLLIHQLAAIWTQTRTTEVATGADTAAETTTHQLHGKLRRYIRQHPDLYERILCYQVLDLDSTYRQMSSEIKFQKSELRKFFDAEGIVSNSNVGNR